MDRVFLDANVLFSAAYREGAGLLKLWKLGRAELITSEYAADEAPAEYWTFFWQARSRRWSTIAFWRSTGVCFAGRSSGSTSATSRT
jgi:hypothetical protein